jgi:alpha-beta hydrolase superfamily lysophospholipase
MQVNEFYVQGGPGYRFYGKSWIPTEGPDAVIAVLHGFADHISRYGDFAAFLTSHQIAVIGIDLPGHGKSSGKRGHITGYPWSLSFVQPLLVETRRKFNDLPIFLYGHGIGGNFVLRYTFRHTSREINGVIVASPWLHPMIMPVGWKTISLNLVGKILPSFTLYFDLDPKKLSHHPGEVKKYLKDRLVHNKISIRLYKDLIKSYGWISENAGLMSYPILIMHGREDKITSSDATIELGGKIASGIKLKIWEGMGHELHHEKNKSQVLEYTVSWIKNVVRSIPKNIT